MEQLSDGNISNNKCDTLNKALAQFKSDYVKNKDECVKLKETNIKLELELKEARELEKSYRVHMQSHLEMIGNLQETVSQLVYLKRDINKAQEDIQLRDVTISVLKKEREILLERHNNEILNLKDTHEKYIQNMNSANDNRNLQTQHDVDTKVAQLTCTIEELRAKIKEMDIEHKDRINLMVLEYEEKLQRNDAQLNQLREQNYSITARTDANIDAYRRRLQEVEEKLKMSQFKQYLVERSLPSQYEGQSQQVERPYSSREYQDIPELESSNCSTKLKPTPNQKISNRGVATNRLEVNYYDNNMSAINKVPEKKGPFNIVKKRKLYNEKDIQDI